MNAAMAERLSAEEALALARVRNIKGFYIHAAQYCLTICVLTVTN